MYVGVSVGTCVCKPQVLLVYSRLIAFEYSSGYGCIPYSDIIYSSIEPVHASTESIKLYRTCGANVIYS